MTKRLFCTALILISGNLLLAGISEEFLEWIDVHSTAQKTSPEKGIDKGATITHYSQGWGELQINKSVYLKTPLQIGNQHYERGLGTHSNASFHIILQKPATFFAADVGIDNNTDTAGKGSIEIQVKSGEKVLVKTPILRGGAKPESIKANLAGLNEFDIIVTDAGDGISYDQTDIADALIEFLDGSKIHLDEIVTADSRVRFFDNSKLPFSFEYGGKSSDEILPACQRQVSVENTAAGQRRVVTWKQMDGGLLVEWTILAFSDRPVYEMNLAFEYHGSAPAEILRNVEVVRHQIGLLPVEVVAGHGGVAGFEAGRPLDFRPIKKTFAKPADSLDLGVQGGWSSNGNLPIWLLVQPNGEGLYYTLGWTGQWKAKFNVSESSRLDIKAGMEHLNLRLNDGERISQPSVLLGCFSGRRWAGHNALRRTLYEKYTVLLEGRKPLPPVSWNHWFTFSNSINEKNSLELVESVKEMGIDYFCIDAGWYNVDFWQSGDWRPNPTKFPNGLEPVAEAIKKSGMVMGLWFDPERVTDEAYEAFEHKEWLVSASKKPAMEGKEVHVWLVDMTIPAAQQWAVDLISGYYHKLDLRWIRYDMNYPPLEMWLNAHENEPDRLGMKEIRYIEGLYKVLDGIARSCPDLCIEWCSGGGRRIDLETIRRSQTFWKSDVTGDGNVTRAHLTGGNQFLPGNYLNANLIKLQSQYDYFCQFAGPLGFGHDFRNDSPPQKDLAKNMIALYKSVRHLLVKDYYPLFNDYPLDDQQWDGWQFHDPKTGEGFFVVLRPESSPYSQAIVKLQGIDRNKTYTIVDTYNIRLNSTVEGSRMQEGLTIAIDSARQAVFVHYKL